MSAPESPRGAGNPFGFDREAGSPLRRLLTRSAAPHIERLFALDFLHATYASVSCGQPPGPFIDQVLAQLDVQLRHDAAAFERLPERGACVAVANHPFGGLEGLLLGQLLLRRRPDVRILANYMLERVVEMREMFIFVDPWARPESRARNAAGLRQVVKHMRAGGMLGVFPAGEVAHHKPGDGGVLSDPPWQVGIGKVIRRAKAPIVPVHFGGKNSPLFHRAGMLHPTLRTLLLPRELKNKRGSRIEVRVGEAIAPSALQGHGPEAFIAELQAATERLGR